MNLTEDMPKSEMLRRSLRCFALGWWSLVPVLGLIPAALAFADFRAVVLRKGRRWNAARTRLLLGAILAGLGVLLTGIVATVAAIWIYHAIMEG